MHIGLMMNSKLAGYTDGKSLPQLVPACLEPLQMHCTDSADMGGCLICPPCLQTAVMTEKTEGMTEKTEVEVGTEEGSI